MVGDLIAVSLPFALSVVVKLVNHLLRGYAERMVKINLQDHNTSERVRQFAVDLAVQTYLQLSFVLSLLMSSISCIAYTILCPRPLLAAIGAAALLLLLPWWIMRWQGLSAQDLQTPPGRLMRASSWAAILLQWAVTLYARVMP